MFKPFIEVEISTGFPFPNYPFNVVSCWGGVDGEQFTFVDKLTAPNGDTATGEFETFEIRNGFATVNSSYKLTLPAAGEYRVDFHINGEIMGSVFLTALQKSG